MPTARFLAATPLILIACSGRTAVEALPHESTLPTDPAACFAEVATALSTDEMQGRGLGTAGIESAAKLIEGHFAGLGLKAGADGYRQGFEVQTGVELGEGNALSSSAEMTVGEQFMPLGFSSSGEFEAEVVFAGYGIQADDLGYNDYDGLDVTGKVVLAMRYEPQEEDANSVFNGRRPSHWSDLRSKALTAREAGAAALVLVAPAKSDEEPDTLPILRLNGPISDAGLPVLQVKRSVANAWLAKADLDLDTVRTAIDGDLKPRSKVLPVTAKGVVDVKTTTATAYNIVGVWPGSGALAEETVIVGAHYDHLGFGGAGSRAPDSNEVHNGADDNASGVAAVLCGMRDLVAQPPEGDRRTIVAMAFSAEESGLGGSSWYVQNPARPMDKTVAMINLDMVGRVRDGKIQAMGSDTAPQWEPWLTAAGDEAGLTIGLGGDGYGPSDQTPFYAAGIPVVHFFSGSHEEYHTPADDAPTLNTEGGGQVATLLAATLRTVTTSAEKPEYVKSTAGPAMAGDSRGYGSYLGTVPDYASMGAKEGGVLLSGVRDGGPADRAGLEGGDRIIKMGDIEIQNLYDMVFVLRDNRPGDTLDVTVVRGEETILLKATLGKRPTTPQAGGHGRQAEWSPKAGVDAVQLLDPREKHLSELRQLTFGGDNAEAYWSPDGQKLMFQRVPPGGGCDQQYVMDLNTGETVRVSSGKGRTTCGYFSYPDGDRLIYATTESGGDACPPAPDMSQGYVWPLFPSFDMVWQDGMKGTPEPFLPTDGYDAEATICMADGRVVFTSTRDGDLELYTVNADGTDLKQLTNTPGYDGGAFFTPDCSEIVWRASRPEGDALADYRRLLGQDLVRPSALEIFLMDADGTNVRQLTENGAANFGPYPYPDASRIIFSSNMGDSPREFELWSVSRDGGEPEQITFSEQFDGFPMFSPDGKHLVFASNRGGKNRETNLFVAKWVP